MWEKSKKDEEPQRDVRDHWWIQEQQRDVADAAWNPNTMSLTEYADQFAALVDMYEASGDVLSEADKTDFLVEAFLCGHFKFCERLLTVKTSPSPGCWSASPPHQEVPAWTSHGPRTDPDLPRDEDITTHFVNNVTETSIKRKREHQDPPELPAFQSAMNVTCSTCDKSGHSAADCWSKEICEKCGKKGHIGSVCRFTGTAAKGPAPKPDSRASKVQQK
eukprot:gene40416-49982_t